VAQNITVQTKIDMVITDHL